MISRMRAKWRWFRRLFSRVEWMCRLLGLPKNLWDTVPGLVLIQLDGLSHPELQRALKKGEMPFLSWLLRREHYEIRPMYSGLPSSTPAVQGELFYGVPGAVPAFGFFDREDGCVRKMIDPESAKKIEAGLAGQAEGLLKGGSSYGNIYTGGADEPRFCAASMGWGTSTGSPGIFVLLLLALLNGYGFVRALAFGALEFALALWDAARGMWGGEKPPLELKFILTRIGICILLREWIVYAAKMDLARGLPIIHLNLLGYDEQAHRRGPDSAFAHWVLKGMDDAVKRIWKSARHSDRRDYDVWIYSDHGQVRSRPYASATGKSLKGAVGELWGGDPGEIRDGRGPVGVESHRIRYLGGKKLQKLFPVPKGINGNGHGTAYPVVADLGPVALIYLEPGTEAERRQELGMRLAQEKGVPLVIDGVEGPGVRGWYSEGDFSLPRDAEKILGQHPFLDFLLSDLLRLRDQKLSGDLILLGWKSGIGRPMTFAMENGSHGGISPEECSAFVAMHRTTARDLLPKEPRPRDLYRAARIFQGKDLPHPGPTGAKTVTPLSDPGGATTIRVMTYNVHSCIGMDRRHDLHRIARVIARYRPDVIALQELETGHGRSGEAHQAREIAAMLNLEYHFHAVRELEDEQFGNAILSRFPIKLVRAGGFPVPPAGRRRELRGALWVELNVDGQPIQVLNTHFGLRSWEKLSQAKALLGERWLGGRPGHIPLILCGDLNSGPKSPAYLELRNHFADCQMQPKGHKPRNTWFSHFPLSRLDHILVSPPLVARDVQVPAFRLAVMASDHLPVVADIDLGRFKGGKHVA